MRLGRGRALASVLLVGAVLWSSTGPVGAAGDQVVHGRVVVPTGEPRAGDVAIDACRLTHATAGFAVGENGVIAHDFAVLPGTHGRQFILTSAVPARMAIAFSFDAADPRTFTGSGLDPVHGVVPAGARSASVCLVAGPPTDFTYIADLA